MNFRALKAPGLAAALVFLAAVGCTDPTVAPKSTVSDAVVFNDPNSYQQFLAKVYAGLAATGQQGPAGNADLAGFDEGFSQYLRLYFELQELPTEEAMIAWGGDGDLMDLNQFVWSAANGYSSIFYSRVFYVVSLANSFLFQTTDDKLASRGVSASLKTQIHQYRAEARFLRAFAYWNALDLFGSVPIITTVTNAVPAQPARDSVYRFVVSELNAIKDSLPDAVPGNYGRGTNQAAHMMLAELYLNAGVYTGTANWTGALTEASEVIGSGKFSLAGNYYLNFLADNNTSPEIIFPITEDGAHTRNYGATTFIIHAECGNSLTGDSVGVPGNCWYGLRIKPQADSFYATTADHPVGDKRAAALFRTGQTLAISTPTNFGQGTLMSKFQNRRSTGTATADPYFVDTDFPVFRLAEAYLIYAEAQLNGGGGSPGTALGYINLLRDRAYGVAPGGAGEITAPQLTLPFVLAERGRELIWEAHRRTDLVRFGQFGGASTYLWSWKGGTQAGAAVAAKFNLFPIPASQIAAAGGKLTQNPGY
jgi:hypothetical protein